MTDKEIKIAELKQELLFQLDGLTLQAVLAKSAEGHKDMMNLHLGRVNHHLNNIGNVLLQIEDVKKGKDANTQSE